MLGIVKEYDSASRAGIKLIGREKQETKWKRKSEHITEGLTVGTV